MATRIFKCKCNHTFQDKKYGKGKRVFNEGLKAYKCTVCNAEKIK